MNHHDIFSMAHPLVKTVQEAGRAIMGVYQSEFDVEYKQDSSPVTRADQLAEDIILASLHELAPDIPVIAEEAASQGKVPDVGERFFLVDPLDGTKEFVSKNGEFTVNIALIEHGVPVFGIIYAPSISVLFVTLGPDHAIRFDLDIAEEFSGFGDQDVTLPEKKSPDVNGFRVVASRSHMNDDTRSYLGKMKVSSLINAGSSLKFCRVAEGSADLYPRFAPTMEWDTAAGHAILLAAGGIVLTPNGGPFVYGKRDSNYLNSHFIAYGDAQHVPLSPDMD